MLAPDEFLKAANLSANPFRAEAVPGLDPRAALWAGNETAQKHLVKHLRLARADEFGSSGIVLLRGAAGAGKTHALQWARHKVMEAEAEDYQAVAFYLPSLVAAGRRLGLARTFREDVIGRSDFVRQILYFQDHLQRKLLRYRGLHKVNAFVSDEAIIDHLIQVPGLANLAKKIRGCTGLPDLLAVLTPPHQSNADALAMFAGIVGLFVIDFKIDLDPTRFKKAAYVLIDDFDALRFAEPADLFAANQALLKLCELCRHCFCLVVAADLSAAEVPAIFTDPVLGRLRAQIVLDPLSAADGKRFVQVMLDSQRRRPNGFAPFEERAIDIIAANLAPATAGHLVAAMRHVMEAARKSGLNPASQLIRRQAVAAIPFAKVLASETAAE